MVDRRMGRKPSARKIARRVLLFVVPAFIIGYAMVSASDDGYSSYGHGSARTFMPKLPPRYERKHATGTPRRRIGITGTCTTSTAASRAR